MKRESLTSRFVGTIQQLKDSMALIMASSCSEFCNSADYGDGVIIGEAPVCDGNCDSDCSKTHCYLATSEWVDYGDACESGDKVCCCGKLSRIFCTYMS